MAILVDVAKSMSIPQLERKLETTLEKAAIAETQGRAEIAELTLKIAQDYEDTLNMMRDAESVVLDMTV